MTDGILVEHAEIAREIQEYVYKIAEVQSELKRCLLELGDFVSVSPEIEQTVEQLRERMSKLDKTVNDMACRSTMIEREAEEIQQLDKNLLELQMERIGPEGENQQ